MRKPDKFIASAFAVVCLGLVNWTSAAEEYPSEVTLFQNVNIFDGVSDQLMMDYDVLVVGNKIHKIAKDIPTGGTYEVEVTTGGERKVKAVSEFGSVYEITVMEAGAETTKQKIDVKVIDGGGRTLTPGFIENHAHLMLMGPSISSMETNSTWEDFAIHGARMAEMYLMQGFTTVRDAGGAALTTDLWTTCFTPRELRLMCASVGLEIVSMDAVEPGNWASQPPDVDSPEFLVIATDSL